MGWEVGIGISVEIGADAWVIDLAETEDGLIAVGQDGEAAMILASDDGSHWQPINLAPLGLNPGIMYTVTPGAAGIIATGGRIAPDPLGSGYYTIEPVVLYSVDGTQWEEVSIPGPCVITTDVAAGHFGFIILGERCRGEGDFDPRPISVLHSADGLSWTRSTDDPFVGGAESEFPDTPSALATDGNRLVAIGGGGAIWISDDTGFTWRALPGPVAADRGGAHGITYGHGQFVASADEVDETGNIATMVSCVLGDELSWACHPIDPTGAIPGTGIAGRIEASPTGFVTVMERLPDQFTAGPSELVVLTSTDGVTWEGGVEPVLHNLVVSSVHPTTRGTFLLGSTNPYLPEDISELRIAVHRAPLP